MNRKSYGAFTLVEMLIVMGILIVLMGIGITAGRFAINRANDVAHQNAVDQIYQGLQAYYTDNREYPSNAECGNAVCTVQALVGTVASPGVLGEFMDEGAFDGGTEATFYYYEDGDTQQTVLVCVTKGGFDDVKERGVYCNGNGFGSDELAVTVADKEIPFVETGDPYDSIIGTTTGSDWNGDTWGS